jgi:hypothetical protein
VKKAEIFPSKFLYRKDYFMIDSINPFNDPEFKQQILKQEGLEIVKPDAEAEEIDFKNIISSAPSIPGSAKNIILDASAIAKNEKEAMELQMNSALNNIFSNYNKTYGTNLQINFSNLSQTLIDVADPDKRKTLELYVSEVFKSIKPVLLLQLISKLSIALDYVLQPERMFDQNQLSIPDLFLVIEKLQSYITNLNDIIETSTIKDSDQILKKLSEEKGDAQLNSEESKAAVNNFLDLLKRDSGLIDNK